MVMIWTFNGEMKGLSLHTCKLFNYARLLSCLALWGYLGSYPKVHFFTRLSRVFSLDCLGLDKHMAHSMH
jgi:hypothetical protein